MIESLVPLVDPDLWSPLQPTAPRPCLAYTPQDADRAWQDWRANCGPWALAGATGMSLDAVRPFFPGFPAKNWTKETHMRAALSALGVGWNEHTHGWPSFGLVRVAWHGPWWDDEDPYARLYHSHWIATHDGPEGRMLFDGNAIEQGGWLTPEVWVNVCVSRLLAHSEPQASGAWRVVDRFAIKAG